MKATHVKWKNIAVAVLCVVFALTLVACNYKPATNNPSSGNSGSSGNGGNNGSGGNSGDGSDEFTAELCIGNEDTKANFASAIIKDIKVIWTDTESSNGAYYSAGFDKDGVARMTGLDGDFRVTLSSLPDGYTYNPNIYFANSQNKTTKIVLYKLSTIDNLGASGNSSSTSCIITSIGAYRAVLTKTNFENGVWFKYQPSVAGDYSFESIIDVTANKLNPILTIYAGNNGGYINWDSKEEKDTGGESSTYTKNFRWEINLRQDKVGNPYFFVISATTLDEDVFPINVDFILDRDGEFTGGSGTIEKIPVSATHDFDAIAEIATSGCATGKYVDYGSFDGNNSLLDGSKVHWAADDLKKEDYATDAEYEAAKKANDYYYVLASDGNKYILYVAIKQDVRKIDENLPEVITTENGKGFTDEKNQPRVIKGKDENGVVHYYNYVDFINTYAAHTNGDGCYPVTSEMQVFLQRFSISRSLFNDGNGIGEQVYQSSENNQWLFICGVYK